MTVFFLCGLWHGASWTFVLWGLYHGLFLVAERAGLERWLSAWPAPLRHVYALMVVLCGWVLFRSDSMLQAAAFLAAMAGVLRGTGLKCNAMMFLNAEVVFALGFAVVGSTPVTSFLTRAWERAIERDGACVRVSVAVAPFIRVLVLALALLAVILWLSATTHNPFIYFRF